MTARRPPDPRVAALAAFEDRLAHYRTLGHDREAAASWVADALPAAATPVLDVGTGKGLVALELARRGVEVVSVDPDAAELALARARVEAAAPPGPVRFIHGSVADLPDEWNSFPAAVMMDVLHHLERAEEVFTAITRRVRSGGVFVVAEFDPPGFELVSKVHREEGRHHRVGPVTVAAAVSLLDRLGWTAGVRHHDHLHELLVFHRAVEAQTGGYPGDHAQL